MQNQWGTESLDSIYIKACNRKIKYDMKCPTSWPLVVWDHEVLNLRYKSFCSRIASFIIFNNPSLETHKTFNIFLWDKIGRKYYSYFMKNVCVDFEKLRYRLIYYYIVNGLESFSIKQLNYYIKFVLNQHLDMNILHIKAP